MMPPTMPVASEQRAVDLLLFRDENTRQEEANVYISHLAKRIKKLEKSFSRLISPGENLALSDFEIYRYNVLEFAKTTAWCLSDHTRLLIFSR